jgi:hypothetical protein
VWSGRGGIALNLLTARVSPDGHYLAFMSQRPLTGYDNQDAVSGKPDEEVYLYHAEGASSGSITCASCDPSGARPHGVEYGKLESALISGSGVWARNTWLAANVPGWTPYELNHALYQPRYLSDSGRLFFNSKDALAAQDINNNQDVYEYEPLGTGDCTGSSASFNAGKGGCVTLVSSGRAAGESAFLDASENGDDVFFLTAERLVSQDLDTAFDVYDAHVCSSEAPCSEEAVSPPACSTAESCRAAPAPQPSIFGSPSSATFSGQGNIAPPAAVKPVVRPLVKPTRAQQLAKALKSCRTKYKKQKKRRASCEAQAKKRYGAKPAKKAAKKNAKKGAKK